MTQLENYKKNVQIWLPDKQNVWKYAILLDDVRSDMVAFIKWPDSSKTEKIKIDQISAGLPPLKNPEILSGQSDLVNLSFLNEPEVLDNLKTRFCDRKEIYTYCGVILIAINPYMDLPIYSTEFMEAYNQNRLDSQHRNEPHIFAVADAALTQMKQFSRDQAIIISGESGAGKTVSAKHVLRYLATIAGAEAHGEATLRSSTACMRSKVVDSCPLLEALGNAKTVRNDNSSRFGKFLEIGFNRRYRIVEARMRTYLLEKSRVVFQSSDERNYHGFYQLLSAVGDAQCRRSYPFLDQLDLFEGNDNSDIFSRYHYANQGGNGQVDGINDLEKFSETIKSMESLGFKKEETEVVFTILAALLHFGNVNYEQTSTEQAFIAEDDAHFQNTLRLLKCPIADSRSALCHRVIRTVDGNLSKPLTLDEARAARDALSKHLYQCMFKWIVKRCNCYLAFRGGKPATKAKRGAAGRKAPNDIEGGRENFIGVLDIYGFETFEVNSFEQFCINYANEKLQQRFVFHVFKLEQEEYLREGLEWDFVEFYDNQPCIDLIEGPMGILSLLNDECKMPKASDANWLARLIENHLNRSPDFSQSKLGARTSFQVRHFAEVVTYTVAGFVEKNCDRVIMEHAEIFKRTSNPLLLEILGKTQPAGDSGNLGARKLDIGTIYDGVLRQPTVATQFSDSLKQLLETLDHTTAHYVRCIKPNDQKAAFLLSPQRTVQQLRACGILQTIKISAAGFPTQWSYQDFFDRYRPLLSWKSVNRTDRKETCKLILQKYILNEHCYRLGNTKIFFSAGVLANMERLRTEELVRAGTLIQAVFRGWLAKRRWQQIRVWIPRMQSLARRWLARKRIAELIRQKQEALIWSEHVK
uniref:Unconventional myosin-Vb n=1 Tax=Schistocephalus solidus TaxID=70667 RepID=A0A0V0J6S7_SCHSO